ncbi:E3 ubiquitin-protein ligase siah-1 [Pieris rapae]|uniref:E3 ubiquitin-protein ligase siah-1 n=1 Tax=Pieris rapae TaxID=64459 RepID=UPI001E27FF9B|nr:E3 ubiquitin-protein ligase siah-1 [Pieris rapae]
MAETVEEKPESVLNLEDLLQCPVCYEIPSGQIFQCNEGHHVCGRCKMRLDVCPVCRAFFFGTRNYAMEELIANFKRVKKLKSSTKTSESSQSSSPAAIIETSDAEVVIQTPALEEQESSDTSVLTRLAPPLSCRGRYRCLCCKQGSVQRLPLARLLNHLRYFHRSDLIEGRSENAEYMQAWQFPTTPGRIVTAVRVVEMGIFFLVIEIVEGQVFHAWMTMAASAWVAHGFNYSLTISGNDREAIFTDYVWSVKSCEGTLKKQKHTLTITGANATAMLSSGTMSGKLSLRRLPFEELPNTTQPRGIIRVARRRNQTDSYNLEPFLDNLQSDVDWLSQAFASLRRTASVWSEDSNANQEDEVEIESEEMESNETQPLSRSARRRMRRRLRAALGTSHTSNEFYTSNNRENGTVGLSTGRTSPIITTRASPNARTNANASSTRAGVENHTPTSPIVVRTGIAIVQDAPVQPSASNGQRQANRQRRKPRHRR